MRKILLIATIATAVIAFVLPANAATVSTSAVGFTFVSPVLTASAGDTVSVTNQTPGIPHNFSSVNPICDKFDPLTGTHSATQCNFTVATFGGTGSQRLYVNLAPGTYEFFCSFHQSFGMVGIIRVG
jgi:plastocyanin